MDSFSKALGGLIPRLRSSKFQNSKLSCILFVYRTDTQVRIHLKRCVVAKVIEQVPYSDVQHLKFDVIQLCCYEVLDYSTFFLTSDQDIWIDNSTVYQTIVKIPSSDFVSKFFPFIKGQRIYKFYDTLFLSNSNTMQCFFKIFNLTELSSEYISLELVFNFPNNRKFSADLPLFFLSNLC